MQNLHSHSDKSQSKCQSNLNNRLYYKKFYNCWSIQKSNLRSMSSDNFLYRKYHILLHMHQYIHLHMRYHILQCTQTYILQSILLRNQMNRLFRTIQCNLNSHRKKQYILQSTLNRSPQSMTPCTQMYMCRYIRSYNHFHIRPYMQSHTQSYIQSRMSLYILNNHHKKRYIHYDSWIHIHPSIQNSRHSCQRTYQYNLLRIRRMLLYIRRAIDGKKVYAPEPAPAEEYTVENKCARFDIVM